MANVPQAAVSSELGNKLKKLLHVARDAVWISWPSRVGWIFVGMGSAAGMYVIAGCVSGTVVEELGRCGLGPFLKEWFF